MMSKLKPGDEVVTIGRLHGVVSEVDLKKRTVTLDCEGVYLVFDLGAIQRVENQAAEPASAASDEAAASEAPAEESAAPADSASAADQADSAATSEEASDAAPAEEATSEAAADEAKADK